MDFIFEKSLFDIQNERLISQSDKTAMVGQILAAKSVYSALQWKNFSAVLAGGAPRDWAHGKLAKDLDFYIHKNSGYSGIADVVQALTGSTNRHMSSSPSLYKHMQERLGISFHIEEFLIKPNKLAVQLMVLSEDTPCSTILNTFDSTICEYYYNFARDEIWTSVRNKKHLEKGNSLVRLEQEDTAHIKRVRKKFPNISFLRFDY